MQGIWWAVSSVFGPCVRPAPGPLSLAIFGIFGTINALLLLTDPYRKLHSWIVRECNERVAQLRFSILGSVLLCDAVVLTVLLLGVLFGFFVCVSIRLDTLDLISGAVAYSWLPCNNGAINYFWRYLVLASFSLC